LGTGVQTDAISVQEISIRQMEEKDLGEADRIVRLAFGTFIGLPDPMAFMGDAQYVRTRWRANPKAAFVAVENGEIVGSNFATSWGSVGFFGPLTVRPDFWDRGVGKLLMRPVLECFASWGTSHAGLFTFAQSQKHVNLYQKFGFWPRFLTAIMSAPAAEAANDPAAVTFSELSTADRQTTLDECRNLTDAIYEGLNVENEIRAVNDQNLGDTVLIRDGSKVVALAVCHIGAGSEAGSGTCYIKFGAVRPGADAQRNFDRLFDACQAIAIARGAKRVVAGVNTARVNAYRQMLARGFRTDMQGVAMQKPNEAGYNRPDVYLIDDWR
jgi:predicted N-acetyltransferase YhbS